MYVWFLSCIYSVCMHGVFSVNCVLGKELFNICGELLLFALWNMYFAILYTDTMCMVMRLHVTYTMDEWVEICNRASNLNCIQLHHQAFPIFLAYIEKHGKAWVRD